jgi:SOS-response transcriptional repressor LexA
LPAGPKRPAVECPWRPLIEWLRQVMELRGIKPAQVAAFSGLPLTTLMGLLHCKNRPSLETLEKLAAYFGQSPETFREMAYGSANGRPVPPATLIPELTGVLLVPKIGSVSAGGGYVSSGYEVIGPIRDASRNLVAFDVRGDCMAPRIEAGDVVIVDLARAWSDGAIVLARVGDELIVKRAHENGAGMTLSADAAGFADVAGAEVQVLGVVVRIMKEPR